MASSTLLYIAWPVTLGLSFIAGGMIFSNEPTPGKTKNGSQSSKISRRNGASNESSTATNRRSSAKRPRVDKDGYAKSYNIKQIANNSDPQKRLAKLLSMIDQLGPGDFEQVLADFRELSMTGELLAEYGLLLNAWAKINPEGALAYAKESTNSSFAYRTILSAWTRYAPDAAIQWATLNREGHKYLLSVIKDIASTDPHRATDILQGLPVGHEHFHAALSIIPHISKLGVKKSIAWLAAINSGKNHSHTAIELASSLAREDPQATIDWLQTFPPETQKKVYGSIIATAFAELDINKAVEWANSLEPNERAGAAYKIIGQFATSDPNKAAAWMKTMSGEGSYKYVVQDFFYATKHAHPKVALDNLAQLSNDWERKKYKAKILLSWTAKDKAAAAQWMQSKGMDAAAQKKYLSHSTARGYGRGSRPQKRRSF